MKPELTNINSGEIIASKKLTSTAWHVKLRVPFYIELDMDRNPGYIIPLLTENEDQEGVLLIRSTLWNYDVVRNTLEIIIYKRKNNEEWLENLSSGNIIQYLDPEEIIIQGLNAETYYLIGDTDAQAFFYQFNRSLPFTSTVNSFIYSKNTGDFFPDIDGSYPLNYHIIYPYSPERVIHLFKKDLSRETESYTILLFCEHEVNMLFSQYFKKEWGATENQIRIANYNH